MCADKTPPPHSPVAAALIWLGGGHQGELGERQQRAAYAVAGLIVLAGAVLAGLVATAAVADGTAWPLWQVVPVTLLCGVLVGAVTRAIASGPARGWRTLAGRIAAALAVGLVVGDLAALVIFAGPVDQLLDQQSARAVDSTPTVTRAAADLDRARTARTALDAAVEQARAQRDDALVVARCEFHPTPDCPQTRITGVPGAGPETRTGNELLDAAQRELDRAAAARDRQAPELDTNIVAAEHALTQARQQATAASERGLGTHWLVMNHYTRTHADALLLRLATIVVFALLAALPMIVRWWRGPSSQDRHAAARAEVELAELQAETAIAVKRAEVRAAAEILWAEQQLVRARLAVEAQTAIDAEQERRRVAEVLDAPIAVAARRNPEPPDEQMYLPIAAEAEAAAKAAAALPALPALSEPPAVDNLPTRAEPDDAAVQETSPSPAAPSITSAAARWIRPLVPPLVARAIETGTQPMRVARHLLGEVFEEVEEITFTLKRTHKVHAGSVASAETTAEAPDEAPATAGVADPPVQRARLDRVAGNSGPRAPLALVEDQQAELCGFDGPPALPSGGAG